jgi:hypothetical protein
VLATAASLLGKGDDQILPGLEKSQKSALGA